jgi:hypothetical protein
MLVRTAVVITLVLCLDASFGCGRADRSTASADDAGAGMLGLDVTPGAEGNEGEPRVAEEDRVPVKCLTDPGDPECEEPLGYTRTDSGSFEFGDVCRERVCHGRGECLLDPEGSVICECDEGAAGLSCEKPRK